MWYVPSTQYARLSLETYRPLFRAVDTYPRRYGAHVAHKKRLNGIIKCWPPLYAVNEVCVEHFDNSQIQCDSLCDAYRLPIQFKTAADHNLSFGGVAHIHRSRKSKWKNVVALFLQQNNEWQASGSRAHWMETIRWQYDANFRIRLHPWILNNRFL